MASDDQFYKDIANTSSQDKYTTSQDILTVDFDQLYNQFIVPVDAVRSHFNALVPSSQELNTPQYQESRCHAFYRMIGFPVVADANRFFSPGFDPNLNTDKESYNTYNQIATDAVNNLSTQLSQREQVPISYLRIFTAAGIQSQAITLGSLYVRAFSRQFGDTDPLVYDQSQIQVINDRNSNMTTIFGNDLDITSLQSQHLLKPFVVDPRIDISVRPIVNRICAPFLKDKSQTRVFSSPTSGDGNLKRPFLEYVISTRFDNRNVTKNPGQDVIAEVISDVLNNKLQTDKDLIATTSDPLSELYSSELTIFLNYIKIIQILMEELASSIKQVLRISGNINFQPTPDPKLGIEGGGKINTVDPTNIAFNKTAEQNIIRLTQKQIFNDIAFETGLQGIPDPGDFVFSNLDDSVFSINKNIQKSYSDNLDSLNSIRNKLGDEGINYLRNIEIIMGEFSGIGLIDMVAIQAALWIMDESSLLGLIDARAFANIKTYRPNINLNGLAQADVISSLKQFEQTLKTIYIYIQTYFDGVNDGTIHTA